MFFVGFWSPEWELEAKKLQSKPKGQSKVKIPPKKPTNSAARTAIGGISAARNSSSSTTKPRNPMEELKGFNMSNLKSASQRNTSSSTTTSATATASTSSQEKMATASSASNPLVAALNDFHQRKQASTSTNATTAATSETLANQSSSTAENLQTKEKKAPIVPTRTLGTLEELRQFDRTRLRPTTSNASDSTSPKTPTVSLLSFDL